MQDEDHESEETDRFQTLPAEEQWKEEILTKIKSREMSPPVGSIVLKPVGGNQPLLFEIKRKTLVIGRHQPGKPAPDIDLTAFQANLQGVSRQHASITQSKSGYKLEDLDSTNGSWVNEKRLEAYEPVELQTGDLIRLGQFVFFIHFSL